MSEKKASRRKDNRRKRRDSAGTTTPRRQPNYRQLRHPFTPQTLFSDDEVQAIHDTALQILEELGISVLLPEARDIFSNAGAKVINESVFMGRDIVTAALSSAPSNIRLRSINPLRAQAYEEGSMIFMAGAGCPNVTDLERGRRPGSLAAFDETLQLAQSFDVIHMFGPSVEPQDIPVHLRHYEMMRSQMRYGDKPLFVYARGREQVQQSFEMIRLGFELDEQSFTDGVWATTVINSNSPRMLDKPMAQGLIDFARAGQMSIITPFCLAGAMAPVSIAGALTLQHAEALAGITLAQLAKKGAPISYGGFSSNVDMKSGSPAFGTPEHVKLQIGAGQLARHIGLPWRSASGSASNTADMQAATETGMSIWGGCMANATLLVHAAGWLEGGLSFGYEKFINDIEVLQSMAEMTFKPEGSAAEIALDAIAEVQPGGHFFATQHTMERYETAFYSPLAADLQNFGSWEDAGSLSSAQRATAIWKRVLAEYKLPESGSGAAGRLDAYIEKKTAAGGAKPLD